MATLKLPGTIPVVKEALNIVYSGLEKKKHFRSFCNFVGIAKGSEAFFFFALRVEITSSF